MTFLGKDEKLAFIWKAREATAAINFMAAIFHL